MPRNRRRARIHHALAVGARGPAGIVLTTDIDTRHLETLRLPNVEVRRHDIVAEDLPEGAFDLAYARLVLEHLSDPDVGARPDGCEPQARRMAGRRGLRDAARRGRWRRRNVERISKTAAAMREVTAAAGADPRLGRSLARRLRARALTERRHGRSRAPMARRQQRRGSHAPELRAIARADSRDRPVDGRRVRGRSRAPSTDEAFEMRSPILWTAWGQRSDHDATPAFGPASPCRQRVGVRAADRACRPHPRGGRDRRGRVAGLHDISRSPGGGAGAVARRRHVDSSSSASSASR